MNYNELEKYLFEIGDSKFAEFSKSLSNSDYVSIGVKNPVLRQLIKEHKDTKFIRFWHKKITTPKDGDFLILSVEFIYPLMTKTL